METGKINALIMEETDNVVTCVMEIKKGDAVVYRKGDTYCTVEALEDIPYCHKIALIPFDEGDEVVKYGEMIGRTNRAIGKGCLVNHENIYSVPRDYESEMV
ncbi:UxaA family hydrolase [Enterocloster asparagiformis]|uniref:UxaA family hydrolase n=1 Tax=Enterocloster asparagiformis TaxID=333367 RepID=UPI000463A1C9|nr:UxaA family hydrolase [Enterocloster asparagiformis]